MKFIGAVWLCALSGALGWLLGRRGRSQELLRAYGKGVEDGWEDSKMIRGFGFRTERRSGDSFLGG